MWSNTHLWVYQNSHVHFPTETRYFHSGILHFPTCVIHGYLSKPDCGNGSVPIVISLSTHTTVIVGMTVYPLCHLWVYLSTHTTLTVGMTVSPLCHLRVSPSTHTTLTVGMTVYPLCYLLVYISTHTTLTVGMTVYPMCHLWVYISTHTTLTWWGLCTPCITECMNTRS